MNSTMTPKRTDPSADLLKMPFTLRGIYLRSTSAWMAPDFDPLIPNQQLFPMTRSTQGAVDCRTNTVTQGEVQQVIRSCTFRIMYEFAYTSVDANSDEEVEKSTAAKLVAELAVDYLMTADDFPEQALLTAWGSKVAIAHTWPYWREYCHAALQRMNLPVTMIPLLNLISSPPTATNTPTETAKPKTTRRKKKAPSA